LDKYFLSAFVENHRISDIFTIKPYLGKMSNEHNANLTVLGIGEGGCKEIE